jgi:hypothetical protein
MYNGRSYRYRAISSRQPLNREESKKKASKPQVHVIRESRTLSRIDSKCFFSLSELEMNTIYLRKNLIVTKNLTSHLQQTV